MRDPAVEPRTRAEWLTVCEEYRQRGYAVGFEDRLLHGKAHVAAIAGITTGVLAVVLLLIAFLFA